MNSRVILPLLFLVFLYGCASTGSTRKGKEGRAGGHEKDCPVGSTYRGEAVYYAKKFHGRKTASGEIFDMNKLTAAHRTLPFGTTVRVINLKNRKSVIVSINDRGPFGNNSRIIDISPAAAKRIDMLKDGVVEVEIEILAYE